MWWDLVGSVHETGETAGRHGFGMQTGHREGRPRFCARNGWPGGAYWVNVR
jgi:hypothetical protein